MNKLIIPASGDEVKGKIFIRNQHGFCGIYFRLVFKKPIQRNRENSGYFIFGETPVICQLAGIEYKSAHALRYGHINYGMKHAKNVQDFKAISLNVMHGSIDITDKIYSRMNIDTVNETISNMGYEENIHITEQNNNDIPVGELLASLPVEIREKIVREKLGLS